MLKIGLYGLAIYGSYMLYQQYITKEIKCYGGNTITLESLEIDR